MTIIVHNPVETDPRVTKIVLLTCSTACVPELADEEDVELLRNLILHVTAGYNLSPVVFTLGPASMLNPAIHVGLVLLVRRAIRRLVALDATAGNGEHSAWLLQKQRFPAGMWCAELGVKIELHEAALRLVEVHHWSRAIWPLLKELETHPVLGNNDLTQKLIWDVKVVHIGLPLGVLVILIGLAMGFIPYFLSN